MTLDVLYCHTRYNKTMESLIDKSIILAICLIAFTVVPVDATSVALLLGAFTVSVAAGLLPKRIGLGLLLAAVLATCLYPPATLFLAPLAYGCMGARNSWFRAVWFIAPLVAFWRLPFELFAFGFVFDIIACILAYRTTVLLSERRQYRVLRDGLREQSLSLEERNKRLREEMSALEERDASKEANVQRSRVSDLRPTLSLANLTERELEIVAYVARGLDNREIATEVFASEGTVRNHISAILQKTGLRNRTQLAIAYLNSLEA